MMLATARPVGQDHTSHALGGLSAFDSRAPTSCARAAVLRGQFCVQVQAQQDTMRAAGHVREPRDSSHSTCDDSPAASASSASVAIRPGFLWQDASLEEPWTDAELSSLHTAMCGGTCAIESFAFRTREDQGSTVIGLFEGSGRHGREAAVAAAASAKRQLLSCCRTSTHLEGSLRKLCSSLQRELQHGSCQKPDGSIEKLDLQLSGTTGAIAIVCRGKITWCCIGDSTGMVGEHTAEHTIWHTLSCSPGLDLPQEAARVQGCGGVIIQGPSQPLLTGNALTEAGMAGVAVSHSLGHRAATFSGLTAEPTISSHRHDPQARFLVVASKALWEVMPQPAVLHFLDRYLEAPLQGQSVASALTLQAQQCWKSCHSAVAVPSISAVVLDLSRIDESASLLADSALSGSPCPKNYPPCATSNADANAPEVQNAVRNGFAHMGSKFFQLTQDASSEAFPRSPPGSLDQPSPWQAQKRLRKVEQQEPAQNMCCHSGTKNWRLCRALVGMVVIPAAACPNSPRLSFDAGHAPTPSSGPQQPSTPPPSTPSSPARAKRVSILPPFEMGNAGDSPRNTLNAGKAHPKPPLRTNTPSIMAARSASAHLENLLSSLHAPGSQDLCLPRFSIPETQPVGVPRVRSAGALSSLLLPIRKAYPSSEKLARTDSDETDKNTGTPDDDSLIGSKPPKCPASPLSPLTPLEIPRGNAGTPRKPLQPPVGLHESFSMPQRPFSDPLGRISPSGCIPTSRSEPVSPARDNVRVHGGAASFLPSFGGFPALERENVEAQKARSDGPDNGLSSPTAESKGVASAGLLRRSLTHIQSHAPPSPFLAQCIRPMFSTSHSKSTSIDDEDVSAGSSKIFTPRSTAGTSSINPWMDDDKSGSRGQHSSRDVSLHSSLASPNAAVSCKLRGGSSALQLLQSASLQASLSAEGAACSSSELNLSSYKDLRGSLDFSQDSISSL